MNLNFKIKTDLIEWDCSERGKYTIVDVYFVVDSADGRFFDEYVSLIF